MEAATPQATRRISAETKARRAFFLGDMRGAPQPLRGLREQDRCTSHRTPMIGHADAKLYYTELRTKKLRKAMERCRRNRYFSGAAAWVGLCRCCTLEG